jgi:predicted XRE-type DNA-binding protein
MHRAKRAALEAAGWKVGDAAEFLGPSDEESRLVKLRIELGHEIRRQRRLNRLTQGQLATRLESSQSRVAKIEAAASDVSLDLMVRGLLAAGGRLDDLVPLIQAREPAPGGPLPRKRARRKRPTPKGVASSTN